VTVGLAHRVVDSAPDVGVRNSQPEGIGRVVVLEDLVCWNNLGRNVVFADRRLRPHAVFATTLFPEEDEPSQYDLDVHAILEISKMGVVLVLNHLGILRGFTAAEIGRRDGSDTVEPQSLWSFVGDVERTVAVAGRLVGSSPRCEGALGLLVSARLEDLPNGGAVPTRPCASAFGEVTAVGVVPSDGDPLIAVGGNETVALIPLVGDHVGPARWEAAVGFRVASLAWHDDAVWAAGPDCAGSVDDYDWEAQQGGGFSVFRPTDGEVLTAGRLPADIAWGTGGVAVAPLGPYLVAAGRSGRVHLIDPFDWTEPRSTSPVAETSLGIAHLAVDGPNVLCGFNRGGYRLDSYTPSSAAPNT